MEDSIPPFCNTLTNALDGMHGESINCLDVREQCSFTDMLIICGAKTPRHARSLLDSLLQLKSQHQHPTPRIEGEEHGQWILVDYGDTVVHIMLADIREYYALEKLWDRSFSSTTSL